MARLTPITSKDQVPAKDFAIVDAIVGSRGRCRVPSRCSSTLRSSPGRVAHLGAFVRFEGSLDMRVRVLAAMTAAREFDAVYVWGAQTGSARRQGVPEETITAIREKHTRGVPPEDAQIIDFTTAAHPQAPRRRCHFQGCTGTLSAMTNCCSSPARSATM
mgnify:CR=1 FL=1